MALARRIRLPHCADFAPARRLAVALSTATLAPKLRHRSTHPSPSPVLGEPSAKYDSQDHVSEIPLTQAVKRVRGKRKTEAKAKVDATLMPDSASTSSGPVRSSKVYSQLPTRASGQDGQPLVPLEPFVPLSPRKGAQKSKSTSRKKEKADGEGGTGTEGQQPSTNANEKQEALLGSSQNQDGHMSGVLVPRIDEVGPQGQAWPALAKDVLTNLARFPGCVLLTRVGGFYESYFDQAPPLSILLSIKLASRTWGGRQVPMAGFPITQLDKYLKILVEDNRKLVAICEEFRSDDSGIEGESPADWKMINARKRGAKGVDGAATSSGEEKFNEKVEITRRVTRVVSPGTLIDEKWMNPLRNNFILSVATMPTSGEGDASFGFGLAWLDLSTSDLHVSECPDVESLRDEIKRITPSEVVIQGDLKSAEGSRDDQAAQLWQTLSAERILLTFLESRDIDNDTTVSEEASQLEAEATHSYNPVERLAISNLTSHLRKRLISFASTSTAQIGGDRAGMGDLISSGALIRHHVPSEVMHIDCNTLEALEVREATRGGGVRGSLVSTVRRTISKGGARLLVEWLTSPSTSLTVINHRHSLVALLLSRPFLHEDLRGLFRRRISRGDITRTIQRIATGRNDEQDLLEVKDFVKFVSEVKAIVEQEFQATLTGANEDAEGKENLRQLCHQLVDLSSLGDRLEGAIDERIMEVRSRAIEAMEREDERQEQGEESDEVEVDVVGTKLTPTVVTENAANATATTSNVKKGEEGPWGAPFEHLIRPHSSKQLLSLTKEYEDVRQEAANLQSHLRSRFSHGKLSLRFLLGQGFVVHFADYRPASSSKNGSSAAPGPNPEEDFTIAYRTKSTRTFYYNRWSSIGSSLLRLQEELKRAESLELRKLRSLVLQSSSTLRHNARQVDELDCLMGFATLAREMTLVRPEMVADEKIEGESIFEVKGGRHIGVELGLLERTPARSFHSNDVLMSPSGLEDSEQGSAISGNPEGGGRLHFITGPNMGGKSTYLRQNALIAILAQAGSFVPATSARMSVVDRLFSRVGAKDDLFRDQSTFMVEMLETSEILRRATSRSFVIADEIGRGTTTNVGIAIAFATLTELSKIGCRALFATHLHELADRMGYDEATQRANEHFSHVRFASTDVIQTEDTITYLHALRPGVNRESHGLIVAALAGMPVGALQVARDTLRQLTSTEALPSPPSSTASSHDDFQRKDS